MKYPNLSLVMGDPFLSQSGLVLDDAEPDLRRVDGDLLADECVLSAGVQIAERALEAGAFADRARSRDEMSPLCTAARGVGGVDRGDAHVGPQRRRQFVTR